MSESKKIINVTRPSLPDLKELLPFLEKIWETRILTNNGPFLKEFENKLSAYLDVPYVTVVANGTSALGIALKCLEISGEVITTPFSFIATTQALLWTDIKPVFIDIEPYSCTINPALIEKAITKETTAILPVHVYGHACKIQEIKKIADRHRLKIIYDAAHAFGVKYRRKSIATYGDLSILSFHATKIFNTFEGGAIVCHDLETKKRLDAFRDFGYRNDQEVAQQGINAKMNEFQAALGISQLGYTDKNIKRLKKIYSIYIKALSGVHGLSIFKIPYETEWNYFYFPIFIDENLYCCSRDTLLKRLKENGINCRKYFYPIIPSFKLFKNYPQSNIDNLVIAMRMSQQVLCLPMYPDLTFEDINRIVNLICEK